MTQNTLSDEIERVKEEYRDIYDHSFQGGPSPLEVHYRDNVFIPFIERKLRSIAEKTVEAVRVEEPQERCVMTCNDCDYAEGWDKFCRCLCHRTDVVDFKRAITEQSRLASRWLGKEENI